MHRAFLPAVLLAFGAIFAGGPAARAGDILRGGTAIGTTKRTAIGGGASAGADAAARTQATARDRLSRTTQSLEAVKALQAAARAAARGGRKTRPADPNQSGKRLPRIPDGLGPKGLEVAPGVPKNLEKLGPGENSALWIGARLPRETGKKDAKNVTIVQTEQQAILNWKTFNVGKKTTLTFDQSAGGSNRTQWVAFNKVNDPTGKPSQILGSIKADGQVYVINRNGIIFGGASQVNVHTLVASALPINDNLIARGLLDNPDAQFLFSAFALPAGAQGTPAFAPAPALTADGRTGDVTVEAGATLTSPTSAAKVGGRIMLVGANVRNAGTISTPDGQTILAAGLQVGITAHASSDPSLRGLDVYVGAVLDPNTKNQAYAGTATNAGLITASRANVTITGRDVRQFGVIDGSTSVSLNGRIDLNASYGAVTNVGYDANNSANGLPFLDRSTGSVTLGRDSVTRILPELASDDRVIGTKLALASQINLRGHAIHLEKESILLAPNAAVDLRAGVWNFVQPAGASTTTPPKSEFVYAGGQIYADRGAVVDVAGTTGVETPLSQNILTLQLRGAELADSPLQRTGILRGPDITIDLRDSGTYNGRDWVGTPLADATGYVGLIERTVGELTVAGGSVSLRAGGSVVLRRGSAIDVSGGWQKYGPGFVETTRVLAGGRLIDISAATPDLVYDGIYDPTFTQVQAKWGIAKTFRHPLALTGRRYERSYIAGRDGGSIAITAPGMALDGSLAGRTTAGTRQLRNARAQTELPASSRLSLNFTAQDAAVYPVALFPTFSPTPPIVTFEARNALAEADAFALDVLGNPRPLRADRLKRVSLSPDLVNREGFGTLSIENSEGRIVVPEDVILQAAPGSEITFKAENIGIRGDIVAPGGKLDFTVYGFSPYQADILLTDTSSPDYLVPPGSAARGNFRLGPRATLSTAGVVIDDRTDVRGLQIDPIALRGGAIGIHSFRSTLASGSVLDVSGGARMDATGKLTFGAAGSIAIEAGQDPKIEALLGGRLILGSTLRGYSGLPGAGGSLAIQAPQIRVGGGSTNDRSLALAPEFFNEGGFRSFALVGIGSRPVRADPFLSGGSLSPGEAFRSIPDGRYRPGLVIEPGTTIAPQVQSWREGPTGPGVNGLALERTLLPEALRSPVSLSFSAKNVRDIFTTDLVVRGDLTLGEGATIQAGPRGSVALKGDTVGVLGSIYAPGGSIAITGAKAFPELLNRTALHARTTVHIGPGSVLSTAGAVVLVPDDLGRRRGEVLAGGSIQIAGNILAEAGATLDVSGASGLLDLLPAELGFDARLNASPSGAPSVPVTSGVTGPVFGRISVPTQVDSDGGSITLAGGQQLFVDSRLNGRAGGPTASGGSLSVSSGIFYPINELPSPRDVSLVVTQNAWTIARDAVTGGNPAHGGGLRDADGRPVAGRGYFAVDRFTEGGFDSLELGGVVRFRGAVTIAARQKLSVASGGVIYADAPVELRAPYVALGTPFRPPLSPLDPARTSAFDINGQPFFFRPTHGEGSLTVRARLIDVGNLSLQKIGTLRLFADNGDIRGDGTLNVAGSIYLRAGQIYPASGVNFTIAASDYRITRDLADDQPDTKSELRIRPGSVVIAGFGERDLPLSAGGALNIHGTRITQGGTLRAPLGTINLGWDGSGAPPTGLITGRNAAITSRLVLTTGSETSVSAADRGDGIPLTVPYGILANGTSWIDPAGVDITAGGLPAKDIRLGAATVITRAGSTIDIRGGGNLSAYRWVTGIGGTRDILASEGSFAVIPGYQAEYAPYAPFNTGTDAGLLGGDPGLVNAGLSVGDRVTLGASSGLPAGTYTLLPARFALLPGAVLVTPKGDATMGTLAMADGSSLVPGSRFNSFGEARSPILTQFEVAPASVFRARAEYEVYSANRFLKQSARALDATIPRLPLDSGHLVFQAVESMVLRGTVTARPSENGIGAFIDISSPQDIVITANGETPRKLKDTLVLGAADLSAFGAESLLIGGVRNVTAEGTAVQVNTGNITVDNAGTPLRGPEIILAANRALTIAPRAEIIQAGTMLADAEHLLLTGNGALVRVASDAGATISRIGVTPSPDARLAIGKRAQISGRSLILDSSFATDLDPRARLRGDFVSLNSGRISLQLNGAGDLPPTDGLVLAGAALRDLRGVEFLSLLSYSSIDIYGQGGLRVDGALELHAGEIRGFNAGGGQVTFSAGELTLDNASRGTRPGAAAESGGTLVFNADVITLGSGRINVSQYAQLELDAADHVLLRRTGRLAAQGDIAVNTPYIEAESSARQALLAGGALRLQGGRSDTAPAGPGLGASLDLRGTSVAANTDIYLPSGLLKVTATTGDVSVGGRLDVGGTAQTIYDLVKYTSGGQITLSAEAGSVTVSRLGLLSVAAPAGGGNAGTLAVSTPQGRFDLGGTLLGQGGRRGSGGSFLLDVGSLPRLQELNEMLNEAAFTETRSIRVRTGDVVVSGTATAHAFRLSADAGAITVTGGIDASGLRGGRIELSAAGSLVLLEGAKLTVAAKQFDAAGKGGAISLEAGAAIDGVADPAALLDIRAGSLIDLAVAANSETSADFGRFTGTLHLRAPQNATSSDLQVAPIAGEIRGASSIVVEGYRIFDLTATGGAITTAVRNAVKANSVTFIGTAGTPTTPGTASATYAAMLARLLGSNVGLDDVLTVRPGAELINRTGELKLTGTTGTSDWSLHTFRFGPRSVPGVLTMRAAGNLVFESALHDGFDVSIPTVAYTAQLLLANPLLPMNAQSWSYRLTAGADFGAADFRRVQPLAKLATDQGSLLLGKNAGIGISVPFGPNGLTRNGIGAQGQRYQVIRTGSGDIDISTGRDVQLRNQFATIYTAGTRISDPTMGGRFDLPVLNANGGQTALGAIQQQVPYAVQYSLGGGNVSIAAQGDIIHLTRSTPGDLIADSSRQLPINWLNRRGYVDPATGEFGKARFGDIASTTWWVDFANFFEGVGALGGGNVTLLAGRNVENVDAVIPTNARMPEGRPDATGLLELGGGDLIVRAGNDIDGGVYYVERGHGTLEAGNSIHTNATRSPSLNNLIGEDPYPEQTWLPTTLFLGKGGFDVSARGDVTLGPVVNPFLLPGGYNNTFWYKTYFSTYAADSAVSVTSVGGSVNLRQSTTLPTDAGSLPLLQVWLRDVLLLRSLPTSAFYQPWIRLNENNVDSFSGVSGLLPGTLRATAFAGDISVVGNLTLSPAPRGTLDLAAGGAINGLQISGVTTTNGAAEAAWGSSRINLSDASPGAIPGVASPFAYQTLVGVTPLARNSGGNVLGFVNRLFEETGSPNGTLQTKQTLHAKGLLHANDPDPVRLYAGAGDISGLTLFSPKAARVIAGNDITDVALYVQNLSAGDVTVVSAGRDIVPFNANSPLRSAAVVPGNILNFGELPLAGDIQVAGPGTLEVLAGRNLDLGTGANNADGTGTGITTIGNARNPYLPFDGASIVLGAGIGPSAGLAGSALDFDGFIDDFIRGDSGARYLAELPPAAGPKKTFTLADFEALERDAQRRVALEVFYLALRDAGRDRNDPLAAGFGNYDAGFAAIDTLFARASFRGDITTRSRDIRTKSGGDISIFAPGGRLTLASSTIGNPLAPPGIITETGGTVSIFTDDDVDIGIGRIFTLRGGDMVIWSSTGDIAAGSASKTVASAPPTRVLVDPQSADVQTDLAGLATGGGIGVLATVEGVPPGDVDLIAPTGVIDAGDAGIRVSGNLNLAATAVLNASNIAVAGTTAGAPVSAPVSAPNIAGLTSAANTAGAANSAANDVANQARQQGTPDEAPSDITVEVLGYGGDESASTAAPGGGA